MLEIFTDWYYDLYLIFIEQTQSLEPGRPPYRHTIDAIRQIYSTEGIGAFYKGLVPSLFGIAHVAVQFPLYEKFKSWYGE